MASESYKRPIDDILSPDQEIDVTKRTDLKTTPNKTTMDAEPRLSLNDMLEQYKDAGAPKYFLLYVKNIKAKSEAMLRQCTDFHAKLRLILKN